MEPLSTVFGNSVGQNILREEQVEETRRGEKPLVEKNACSISGKVSKEGKKRCAGYNLSPAVGTVGLC